MPSVSDPLDEAFPESASQAAPSVSGDPLDAAFPSDGSTAAPAKPLKINIPNTPGFDPTRAPTDEKGNNIGHRWGDILTGPRAIIGAGENILSGITSGIESLGEALTSQAPGTYDTAYRPRTEMGKGMQEAQSKAAAAAGNKIFNAAISIPAVSAEIKESGMDVEALRDTLAERVPQALGAAGTVAGAGSLLNRISTRLPFREEESAALEAANPSLNNPQSISAASASALPESVEGRAADFSRHGVQPMEGQLTRDPQQFSAEQNSSNAGIRNRINTQEQQMTDALDTIRRDAAPDTVQNNHIENGQIAVDKLKAHDKPIRADIAAKYKALTDANGGTVPLDTSSFLYNVDAALKKNYLTSSVPAGGRDLLNSLRNGEKLDFEGYEAARTRLAEAQRNGGSEGAAAKIIRNELEQLPLSPEATNLKGLADTARAAAKARFDALDADPGYQAAVDDVANGVKRGQPSPIADNFLDKYVLRAPKANVDILMGKLDDEGKSAVTSHFLGEVRKATVTPNGTVSPAGFNRVMQKYAPKMESFVTPETADSLESLGRVITNAKVPPSGNVVNYSKSGVIVNAAKGLGETALNTKTGGFYGGIVKPIIGKVTEGKFAHRTLNPEQNLGKLSDLAK